MVPELLLCGWWYSRLEEYLSEQKRQNLALMKFSLYAMQASRTFYDNENVFCLYFQYRS